MPLRRETVLEEQLEDDCWLKLVDPEDILFAAATTLVTIGGGGCVIAQELTSEISNGFVGSRISVWDNAKATAFGRSKAVLSTLDKIPVLPKVENGVGGQVIPVVVDIDVAVDVVKVNPNVDDEVDDVDEVVRGFTKISDCVIIGDSCCDPNAVFVRGCSAKKQNISY